MTLIVTNSFRFLRKIWLQTVSYLIITASIGRFRSLRTRTGFTHSELATLPFSSVKLGDGGFFFRIATHFDKSKPSYSLGFAIDGYRNVLYSTVFGESFRNLLGCYRIGKIPNINGHRQMSSLLSIAVTRFRESEFRKIACPSCIVGFGNNLSIRMSNLNCRFFDPGSHPNTIAAIVTLSMVISLKLLSKATGRWGPLFVPDFLIFLPSFRGAIAR